MTKKLTLSIDDSTIERAKEYARANGQSLSEIVENYLKLLSSQTQKPRISPKISKLKGAIMLPEGESYKELLKDSISEKYSK
jgi:hypothetical protein